MGVDYYQPLIDYMDKMAQEGTISKDDLHYIIATEDIKEAQCHIRLHMKDHYKVKRSTRSWILGERKSKKLRKRTSQQSEVQKK
jgi:predicted Rossmann-fold nucleotide-binding protein